MATKIRLKRIGAKKNPAYRVVVADSRAPRNGRFIEEIGYYQPVADPIVIKIDEEKALYWLSKGAQATDTVRGLLKKAGIWEKRHDSRAETEKPVSE
ncbi:MAG TPA: 30S ribosomal protein S16 [Syntrophomonadaceae bacterium]|nr:30S ribosomal protein S16 [Syntrophomonadaceae bacterium]